MDWKQRVRDSKTLIANAYALFSQMGIKTHAADASYAANIKEHLDFISTLDPARVDCGILLVKIFDPEKNAYNIVGGTFGNQLELGTMEMLLGGKIEEMRIMQEKADKEVKH